MSVQAPKVMTVQEMATYLVDMCRKGEGTQVVKEIYCDNAKSIESMGDNKITEGKEAILGKHAWWDNAFEVHSMEVADPIVADNFFSTSFTMDTTNNETKERTTMSEIAVYEVKDGKIVCEQFFYGG